MHLKLEQLSPKECRFRTLLHWFHLPECHLPGSDSLLVSVLLYLELTLLVLCVLQGVRNTLAGEESQVELLKAQLKELFRFSEDSRHLSDDVLAVVKEHQRCVTGKSKCVTVTRS